MRISSDTYTWARSRVAVRDFLVKRGYPDSAMLLRGLSRDGYLEVRGREGGVGIDIRRVEWYDPADWEWLLSHAPLELEEDERG